MKSVNSAPYLRLLLAVILMLCGSASVFAASPSDPAPNFTLKALDGKNLKLSELTGTVVLLNFWASWCGPCRQEMPLLNAMHNKYEPLGFTVLGVNVEQNIDDARGFMQDFPVDFPVVLDQRNEVSSAYKIVGMPTTLILDRDGNIRYRHVGYKPGEEKAYRKMVKKLIRE